MPARSHVLLLRGVNVGGKNRLPMDQLTELVRAQGAADVRAYIQSGNVVCTLTPAQAATIARGLADAIQARVGFRSPVVVRDAAEIRAAIAAHPWDAPEDERYIMFLADLPSPALVAGLDPERSPGHRYAVIGRDVHLNLPTGVASTKLTNDWFDRQLRTVSTSRNWRTLLALDALLEGREPKKND